MRINKLSILFLTAAVFLAGAMIPGLVSATTIGISPVEISNAHLLRGSVYEKDFRFTLADVDSDMVVDISVDADSTKDWISFSTGNEFAYKKDQQYQDIKVTVKVPEDAAFSNYKGVIRFNAKSVSGSNATAAIVSGTRINLDLTVSSSEYQEIVVNSSNISISEDGNSILLTLKATNNSNVKTTISKAVLDVTDLNGESIEKLEQTATDQIEPFSVGNLTITFPNNLKTGQYFANLEVYLADKKIYENKLYLDIKIDGNAGSSVNKIGFDTNDLYYLAGATILGVGVLLLILKFVKKKPKKFAIPSAVLLMLPVLFLLGCYGYYGKKILDVQQAVNETNQSIENSSKALNEKKSNSEKDYEIDETAKVVKFNKDTQLYKEVSINPEASVIASAGSEYSIVEQVSNWYKLEVSPGVYAYLQAETVK